MINKSLLFDDFANYLDIKLDCGNKASFDHSSGIAHRCNHCGAVIGSVSEPKRCRALREHRESKEKMWKELLK
jgi:hypothetical protein